jgi:hypothetical protein
MGKYVIIDDKNKVIRRICCTHLNVPEGEGIPDNNGLSVVHEEYYNKNPRQDYKELGLFDKIGD